MEKLERTLEAEEGTEKETGTRNKAEELLFVEVTLYKGLRRIEEGVYSGGTSIQYWM